MCWSGVVCLNGCLSCCIGFVSVCLVCWFELMGNCDICCCCVWLGIVCLLLCWFGVMLVVCVIVVYVVL